LIAGKNQPFNKHHLNFFAENQTLTKLQSGWRKKIKATFWAAFIQQSG